MNKPVLALTMGDPAGVGPELMLRAMCNDMVLQQCVPVLIGNMSVLQLCSQRLGLSMPQVDRLEPAQLLEQRLTRPAIVDMPVNLDDFKPAAVSAHCGQAAFDFIQTAIDAAIAGTVDAVTTGPINKEALRSAGIDFPGHTEMFALRTQAARWCMMQYSEEITCTFVTVHCGYAEVPQLLTEQNVLDTIELTHSALAAIRGRRPKLAICGLNPHAGENGLFGDREEERILMPAIERARLSGISIEGPLPPDTAFLPARRKTTDAVVCLYHDQGHIPLKALVFDTAVNTTLGLPIVRTSVDHGTAFDIAWQGTASESSLLKAIGLATKLCQMEPNL